MLFRSFLLVFPSHDNPEAETINITQDIKNKQAVEKLTQVQGEIQELEYMLKGETYQQQKDMIGRELEKLIRTNKVLEGQGKITDVEAANAEERGRLQLANIALDNVLKESQNANVKSNTVKIKEEAAVIFKDYLIRAKNANPYRDWETNSGVNKRAL